LSLGTRANFYEATGAFRDMVVTTCFKFSPFTAMEPPTALEPVPISEEKNKVFRQHVPINLRCGGAASYTGYRRERASIRIGDGNLHCVEMLDRQLALGGCALLSCGPANAGRGQRIISIAFPSAQEHVLPNSGVGLRAPTH